MKEKVRRGEEEKRDMQVKESTLGRKLTKLENKLCDTTERMKSAQDENTNLLLELQGRPTVKQYRAAERRIDELERKLYAAVEAAQEVRERMRPFDAGRITF